MKTVNLLRTLGLQNYNLAKDFPEDFNNREGAVVEVSPELAERLIERKHAIAVDPIVHGVAAKPSIASAKPADIKAVAKN